MMGVSIWTQMQVYLLSLAALIAAVSAVWLFKPTRLLVSYLARGFVSPGVDAFRGWLQDLIREETADIRAQIFPNGGSSLADAVSRTNMRVADMQGMIHDISEKVTAIHDTGETPVVQSQPPDLQV